MDDKKALKLVPKTLFERSVTFEVTILKPSFIDRLKKRAKKEFSIQPATLGTMVKISEAFMDIDMENFDKGNIFESTLELVEENGWHMAYIVSLAVCNSKDDPPRSMTDFFMNNLSAAELAELVNIIIKQIDTENFLKSIISARGVNLLSKMNPRTQGSTLAPGKPSEV